MTSKGPEHGNHGVVLTEHPFFKIKCLCVQAKQSMYVLWQLIIVPSKRTIVRLLSARGTSRTADMEQRRVEPMHIVGVLAILCVLTQLLWLCQLPAYALYLPLHISCWLFQSVKHRLNSKRPCSRPDQTWKRPLALCVYILVLACLQTSWSRLALC